MCLTIAVFSTAIAVAQSQDTELLLAGGMLYSLTHRSYKSLHLPTGWSIADARYAPDGHALAMILVGTEVRPTHPPTKIIPSHVPIPIGPITKTIRAWKPSTHMMVIDRTSGAVLKSWPLASLGFTGEWTMAWTTATELRATAHWSTSTLTTDQVFTMDLANKLPLKSKSAAPASVTPGSANDCNRTLTETPFEGKLLRFKKDAATCSSPPENSDIYQLIHPHDGAAKDEILWEYRVPADQTACAEPYACYTGTHAQFMAAGNAQYLVWDGDLFTVQETDNEIEAKLITQLLPQFSQPLGIALNDTHLNALDWEPAIPFQPVNQDLRISHGENPVLYAQNFLPTRSFNATVEIGDYKKNVMVPAGTQVGPIDIGSFKDRAYTPVLTALRWTSFHHLADPVYCQSPYTISSNTTGMIVSITQDAKGNLQCGIHFQEDR